MTEDEKRGWFEIIYFIILFVCSQVNHCCLFRAVVYSWCFTQIRDCTADSMRRSSKVSRLELMHCVLLLPLPIYCPRGNLYCLSDYIWILNLKWNDKYFIYIYLSIEEWSCFCLNFRLFNFNKMMIYENTGGAPL